MRVFLSSTYADLIQHRLQAAQAVERLGQQTGRMEVFGARPQEPTEACFREIDRGDLFLGMYAYRYGYVPEGSEESITEMEYQHAIKAKKPMFCYLIDESHPWPPKMIEDEPGRSRLVRFKERTQKHVVRDTFTTPEDLAMKVATSVGRYVTERSAPIYDGLHNFIKQQSESQESDRRDTVEALSAAVKIANRTFQYFANQGRTGKRDYNKEQMLAQGWSEVGVQLARLKNPPTALIERFFMKAQYWSSPDDWTAERIAASRIGLEEIAKESRSVLLGRTGGPGHT